MTETGTLPMTAFVNPIAITESEILADKRFPIKVVPTVEALWDDFACELAALIKANNVVSRRTTVILPVGPFDYRRVAALFNSEQISCAQIITFNMDEYCDAQGRMIPWEHPLSFRSFMKTNFYDVLAPHLRPRPENMVFPDPQQPEAVGRRIADEGGIDACYGGFGIDGHFAFNVPPWPDEPQDSSYFDLPTRLVRLTPETRAQSAFGCTSGDIASIPHMAVTIGMREIMGSARMRVYLMRPWQCSVLRRVLYGPITPRYPASILQQHPDLSVTMVEYVLRQPRLCPG